MISNQPKYWINGILNSTFPVITTAKPGTYNLTLMSWGNFDGYTLAKTTIPIEIIENPELPMPFFVVHLPLKFDLGAKSSTGQSITLAGFTAYDGCGARIPNVPLKVEFIRVDYGKVLQTKDILSDKNGNYSVSSDPIHIGFGQYNVHLTSTYKGLVQSFEAESPITMNYQIPEQGKNPIMQLGNTTQFVKTIPVGITPDAIAVNRVTDKIYVANLNSGTVSIIDGTNNTVRNVKVGVLPGAIAINSKTNMIYVANYGIDPKVNDTVSVIDGWNNAVSTIPVGHYPYAIAVNTVTNKIYVTNYGSGTISVIDGTNNEVNTVKVGGGPIAGAVNSLTIMIYIANSGIGVLVMDGKNNKVIATIPVSEIDGVYGTSPNTFAINSATNTIYITNYTAKTLPDASLLVIDGASNSVKNIPIRGYPYSVAVNPQTNKIYVTDPVTGGIHWISVIDGENNTVNTIPVGNYSHDVIVNSLTNKIYVTNNEDEKNGTVSIINGSNNAVCTIPVQVRPNAIAINNMTNMIYVANRFSNTISAIYDSPTICTTAIPEFPFIGLILFVSITSIIVFYRIKIS